MTSNTPVSSSRIRRPRLTTEPTILNNVCHNFEASFLSSAGSKKILETDRPNKTGESVYFYGEQHQCLKMVKSSSVDQTCHRVLHNSAFENLEFSNYGFTQHHDTCPKYDRRLYRMVSLDNFTVKTETLSNEIERVTCFNDSHKHKHGDKPIKRIPDFFNFSWTIMKFLLVLLLLVDVSSAIRDRELSVTDISSVGHSPCLLHFSATTLVYTRHPYNCSIFYICYAFKQWEMICSQSNTVFSLRHRVCVWKNSDLDDCQDNLVDNEDDYLTNPTFANNVEDANNNQFQFSINKEINTELDSQYAILSQQPLKNQNSEIRGTEILKDKVADLYEALKKDETTVLQRPAQEEMKKTYFKSGWQTNHKPESWYTFMFSHPQTLETSVHDLPLQSSTIDFITNAQSVVTFHETKTTKPFHLEKIYTVTDGNVFVEGNDTIIDGEEAHSDNDKGPLEDTRRDVMSGEIKQDHLDEITDVLSSEIEDILSIEMVDVLPGEMKDVSSSQVENVLPGEIREATPGDIDLVLPVEVNNELPSYRIDYSTDKIDFSSLVGAEHKHGGEVAIEDTKEKPISVEDRTNDIVNVSSDVNTDISDVDFTSQELVTKSENVDKNTDSIEIGGATKLNEDIIFLTKDRKKSHIKSSVTDSAIEQNKVPQFQLPFGQFLNVDDNNLTLAMQYVGNETIPLFDRLLINEIGLSLPDDGEHEYFNESKSVKSERESNVRPGVGFYKPEQFWLNLSKAQHVDFNTVEDMRRELGDNNYVTNKQHEQFDNQNVKHESVPFRDVRISSVSEYFQNTANPNWNKLWNPKLDIHKANYQIGNSESKPQPNLTTKQNSGQEYVRNQYKNWKNNIFVANYNRSQKYGKSKYNELATATTAAESTLVVRPWQGLSNKLRIPSTKYKLLNGLNVKEINQGKYGDSSLLKKFVRPWQPVNMYNKITKLNGSGITIKKQIKSIREKVHKIADKISNIFWLNPQSTTPSVKNHTYVNIVNHSKMSPKQDTGKTNSNKSPMWFLKSRYINKPLPRHTDKSQTPQQIKDRRRSYVLKRSRKHKNKNRRMRIIPRQKNNTKVSKKLQTKKTRKQNKNVQQKLNLIHRSRNNNTFKFIPGRHDKNEQQDVRFIADMSNTDSKDVKFISSRSNFKDAKEVKFIPGINYNNRENFNFGDGKQVDSFGGDGLNPVHIQNRIMARYYHTYLQKRLHRLLKQLKHPSLGNEGKNQLLNETKQTLSRNHTPLKDTHTKRPSKQTAPKISSPEKLSKSFIKLGPWKNPQYIFSRMQLPQLEIKSGQDTKLGHLYSEIDVNSQNINENRVSDLLNWKIRNTDEESTKKYIHPKLENTRKKIEPEKNAIDDLYLGNIIGGSVTKTDNPEHVKTKNKSILRLEDLKIDFLPKIFLDTKLDLPDWETSRRFSYKILSRPKMPLPGETTTTTILVYPPSTNMPSPPPPTMTTMTTPTTARMAVFTTNMPDITTVNTTTTTSAHKPSTNHSETEDIPEYRKELKDRCGVMATPLIIGGRKSRAGQWPWQVSLQIVTSTTPWHRCGGVLVHSRWVLTAAHCVEGSFYGDIINWRVVMADYDLESVSGNEIYRSIKRVISHPDYVRSSNFPNDVALLELDSPVDLTSGDVQTACLPDADFPLTPGTKCWISGWGETRGSGGKENVMNEVPVDVMSHDQCKPMWGRVDIDVLDSQVCLGYGDTGACYGDSGGPLMCEREGRFYVAGVMSWLINNCSANNFPNVFTRLPNYMDWLYKELDYFEWFRHL